MWWYTATTVVVSQFHHSTGSNAGIPTHQWSGGVPAWLVLAVLWQWSKLIILLSDDSSSRHCSEHIAAYLISSILYQGNPKKRLKTCPAPSSPPSSDDDGDSDWEPEKERNVNPARRQTAARAAKGRGSGKIDDYDIFIVCFLKKIFSS